MAAWADPIPEDQANGTPLSLGEALRKALEGNPNLAARAWDIPAASAGATRAGLRPNPELSLEVEQLDIDGAEGSTTRGYDLGLSAGGPAAGISTAHARSESGFFGAAELTLRLSQVIELGGKRAARIAAAQRGEEVAAWDVEAARYALALDVMERFTRVLAAQERARQAASIKALAMRLAETVAAQVEAGSVSPLEGRRARAEARRLALAVDTAEAALASARIALAETWGAATADFGRAAGDLDALPALPDRAVLLAAARETPAIQRWTSELARREALVRLADRDATPDLRLTFGYRAERRVGNASRGVSVGTDGLGLSRTVTETDDDWAHSLVLGGSIPIPLFDRNQGGRAEARVALRRAEDERRAAETALVATLNRLHVEAAGALRQLRGLEDDVLPELEATYALTREGYERGKFDFIAVLDAEHAVADARIEATEARIAYHLAIARMEGLTGAFMAEQGPAKNEQPAADAAEGR
jgi:cobalt-zinc-cadmium efflux system outer membrane protein